jgi:hypothetical protein
LLAGAWKGIGADRFSGDVSIVRTTSGAFATPITLWYTDVSASWRREHSIFSAGATLGARSSNHGVVTSGGWGMADASVWVAPHVAIVGGVGRSLADVVRGVPRITYASVALRLSVQPRYVPTPPRTNLRGPHLTATREYIEIRVDSATTVEVMGDFTSWSPVALRGAGTVWRLERSLSPGLHRLAIRIDGGEWSTPVNLPSTTDDLGAVVALVTIP